MILTEAQRYHGVRIFFSARFFFQYSSPSFFLPQVITRVPQVKFVVPRDFFFNTVQGIIISFILCVFRECIFFAAKVYLFQLEIFSYLTSSINLGSID